LVEDVAGEDNLADFTTFTSSAFQERQKADESNYFNHMQLHDIRKVLANKVCFRPVQEDVKREERLRENLVYFKDGLRVS